MTAKEELAAILNDKNSYEYEGLSWEAVDEIRNIFCIPELEGAWLA